jgi:competence protein ComFC
MPKKLSAAGLPFLKKLVAYRSSDAQKAENKVIYFLKRNKNKRVARFMAIQLSEKLREIFEELEMDKESAVLTYLPRSRKAMAEYGFDQSELVCRELSQIADVELLPMFIRKRGRAGEQKKLDAKQRGTNASTMFELDIEAFSHLGERSVIVFDDVVTSGASMTEAVKILRRQKVRDLYGMCIAYTVSENNSSR